MSTLGGGLEHTGTERALRGEHPLSWLQLVITHSLSLATRTQSIINRKRQPVLGSCKP